MSPAQLYKLQNSGLDFTDISVWYRVSQVTNDSSMLQELAEHLVEGKI